MTEHNNRIERLIVLYEQARAVLLKLGKSMSGVAIKRDNFDKVDDERVFDDAEQWISAFLCVRVVAYNRAKGLVSEKVWEGYENMGVTRGIYELDCLNEAKRRLLADWSARPNLFRRIKDKKQEPKKKKKKGKAKA